MLGQGAPAVSDCASQRLLRCNIKRKLRSGSGFSRERVAYDLYDIVATDAYVIELSVRELGEFPHSLAIAPPIGELPVNCFERRHLGSFRSRFLYAALQHNA
jgi:hypothetical protein